MKNGTNETIHMEKLDIRDFFDAYEGNPYQRSAISQLYGDLLEKAPELLESNAEWFQTWAVGGKKVL